MGFVIYCVRNKINGKYYIGQTQNFIRRKICHLSDAKAGHDRSPKFYRALRKYGPENFEWSVLEECSRGSIIKREIYWINYFDSKDSGYNCTDGGEGSLNPSEETRKKMSLAKIGKPTWNKGIHLSDKHKNKLSLAHMGKIVSEETRKMMSLSHRGDKSPHFGVEVPHERKVRISKSLRKISNSKIKKIFDLRHRDGLKQREIAEKLMISQTYVSGILNDKFFFQRVKNV